MKTAVVGWGGFGRLLLPLVLAFSPLLAEQSRKLDENKFEPMLVTIDCPDEVKHGNYGIVALFLRDASLFRVSSREQNNSYRVRCAVVSPSRRQTGSMEAKGTVEGPDGYVLEVFDDNAVFVSTAAKVALLKHALVERGQVPHSIAVGVRWLDEEPAVKAKRLHETLEKAGFESEQEREIARKINEEYVRTQESGKEELLKAISLELNETSSSLRIFRAEQAEGVKYSVEVEQYTYVSKKFSEDFWMGASGRVLYDGKPIGRFSDTVFSLPEHWVSTGLGEGLFVGEYDLASRVAARMSNRVKFLILKHLLTGEKELSEENQQ